MRVLHVNLNFYVSTLYEQFSNHLISNGCDLTVYYPTIIGLNSKLNYPNYLIVENILNKYDRLLYSRRNEKIIGNMKKKLDITSYKILHAHSLFSNGNIAYTIKKKYGLPYIVAVRNTDINLYFKRIFFMRKKGLRILQEAEKIIFLSLPYKEYFINNFVPQSLRKELTRKIEVIPNGINQYWLDNKYTLPRSLNQNSIRVLSVGVINRLKNPLSIAKACKILMEKYKINIELLLVGEVKDKRYYNKLTKYQFIKHIPYQSKEKLKEIYEKSDIFVMPSFAETFGLVYAEALTQGLPVIYSKGQGFDKQFDDGIVGYPVQSNNVNDIANKIMLVIKNYQQISHNCISFADKFSWDRISKRYISIYESIISK